jgi:NAD(P)H-flavin reductase
VDACVGGDVLLVAGGLGLAPLRPALYALLARRAEFGRITLLYGTRQVEDLLFRGELERWQRRGSLRVEVTLDHADAGWQGNVGVVTTLIRRVGCDPANTRALLCGPEAMMRFAAAALLGAGLAPDRLHLSLERNMHCALGLCGRCQLGPAFVCRDGAVFAYDRVAALLAVPEL